jgi:hypothetical protein
VYHIQLTDTFGGDANYCWIRNGTTKALKQRTVVRDVKRFAGWTGIRCEVTDSMDGYVVRPRGICQIAFVTWQEGETDGR